MPSNCCFLLVVLLPCGAGVLFSASRFALLPRLKENAAHAQEQKWLKGLLGDSPAAVLQDFVQAFVLPVGITLGVAKKVER